MSQINEKRLNDILTIVKVCESIQNTNESAYTKEQAKISAYDEIAEMIMEGDE